MSATNIISDAGASGLTDDLSAGLPTEAELTRLATELFNELPHTWEPGKTCPDLAQKAAARLGVEIPDADLAQKALADFAPTSAASSLPAAPYGFGDSAGNLVEATALLNIAPDALHIPLPGSLALGHTAIQEAVRAKTTGQTGEHRPYYFLSDNAVFPSGLSVPGTGRELAGIPTLPALGAGRLDVEAVRQDFPILRETVHGRPLIWLDNAATTQKPQAVIDRLAAFYARENSNIHRAAHELAARATDAYEAARETARRFINARSVNEVVFVRGTTEGINLVAQSWGRQHLKAGDEILITWLEHHANIVPWQQLAAQTGAALKVAPVDDLGQVRLEEYEKLLNPRTRLVAFTQVSNALGTVTPAALMTQLAHAQGAKVLVDGAQSVSHLRADVQALDCDWFVFSGHKVFGPTGIGVVYGKEALLNATDPWQGGGNMIQDVTFERTLYQDAPARFEAGTGNIADAVGLGAALEYVEGIGLEAIAAHEHELLTYGTRLLEEIPGLKLIGKAAEKAGVLSFVLEGVSTEDVGAALNKEGIAVRSGHHCAQPILRRFGLEATVRPSLALYNTHADLDALVTVVRRIRSQKSDIHVPG
ncbi:MAG: cysteine desulfurase [Zoogloeaceae bacterium]|jgi:cysteine desulfurase/selenocysteine lyase|nr:cysteine desulfurase [Zoogloeaceae bacterium]